MRLGAVRECGSGDVDVHPGNITDETLEKLGRGDRARPAAFANILDVGDFTLDQLVEQLEHRKLPHRLPFDLRRPLDRLAQRRLIGHQPGDLRTQGDHASTGQGCQIDDR